MKWETKTLRCICDASWPLLSLSLVVVEKCSECQKTGKPYLKKVVSTIKRNEYEKKHIPNAQETLYDISWAFPSLCHPSHFPSSLVVVMGYGRCKVVDVRKWVSRMILKIVSTIKKRNDNETSWLFTHYKRVRFKLLNLAWTQNWTCGPVSSIHWTLDRTSVQFWKVQVQTSVWNQDFLNSTIFS